MRPLSNVRPPGQGVRGVLPPALWGSTPAGLCRGPKGFCHLPFPYDNPAIDRRYTTNFLHAVKNLEN